MHTADSGAFLYHNMLVAIIIAQTASILKAYVMSGASYALARYKAGRLCGAGAFDLLMITYSEAILGCNARDARHAIAAISVLLEHLEKDPASELVQYLSNAYEISIKLININKFDMAATLLQAVRESWREAHQQMLKQSSIQKSE